MRRLVLLNVLVLPLLFCCSCSNISWGLWGEDTYYYESISLPPLASAGADQAVAPASLVTLSGYNSYHPSGRGISYRWVQLNKNSSPSVLLTSNNVPNPSFIAPLEECELQFRLEVGDGNFCTYDDIKIIVTADVSRHGYGPLALAKGDRLSYAGAVPTNDDIAFVGGESKFNRVNINNCGLISRTNDSENIDADYTVWSLTATSGELQSAPDFITIFENDSGIYEEDFPDITGFELAEPLRPGQEVVLTLLTSGFASSYYFLHWRQLQGEALDFTAIGDMLLFKAPKSVQNIVFAVSYSDGQQEGKPFLIELFVGPAANNHAPIVQIPENLVIHTAQKIIIDGAASWDYDGDSLTYQWRQLYGSQIAVNSWNEAQLVITAPDYPGKLVYSLEVCDYQLCSPAARVLIVVTPPEQNRPPQAQDNGHIEFNPYQESEVTLSFMDPEQDNISQINCKVYGKAASWDCQSIDEADEWNDSDSDGDTDFAKDNNITEATIEDDELPKQIYTEEIPFCFAEEAVFEPGQILGEISCRVCDEFEACGLFFYSLIYAD